MLVGDLPTGRWTGREAVALRQALRLTNDRFAARLGVSARTVTHWTANPCTIPRPSAQDALDEALQGAVAAARLRFGELIGAKPHAATAAELALVADSLTAMAERLSRVGQSVREREEIANRAQANEAVA